MAQHAPDLMFRDVAQMRGQQRAIPPGVALGFGSIQRGQNPGLGFGAIFAFAPGSGRVGQGAQALRGKTPAHLADGGGPQLQSCREDLVLLSLSGSKENARPYHGAARRGRSSEQSPELGLFAFGEFHAGSCSGHAQTLIPTRTLASRY